jgi:serine/threonine protein kinase
MEMVALRTTTPPPSPSAIQPEVNPDLEAVILKALALNPAERYQSGADLADALENSLPLVEATAQLTADEPPPIVSRERAEAQLDPSIITTPSAEGTNSPPTAVPFLLPVQSPNATLSSQRKFAGLPIPFIAAGGCLILFLLAVLTIGGSIFIREQLADRYQAWLPVTIQENQESPPDNDAYPAPPNTDSSEENPQENSNSVADEDDDKNEPPDSEVGRSFLRIATNGEDSFYLINIGSSAVPLPFFFFTDGNHVFDGSGWGISTLGPGECVSIWKDRGNPRAPDVDCNEVGERVEMEPSEEFWKEPFDIIFQNTVVITCPSNGCEFSVPNE